MPISAKFKAAQKKVAQARRKPQKKPSVSQQVARAINKIAEHKYVDFVPLGTGSPPATNWDVSANTATNTSIFCINVVQQGTAFFNRVGRKTKLESIRAKLNFLWKFNCDFTGAPLGTPYNQLRLVMVYDRENTGNIPAFSDIFGTTDQTGQIRSLLRSPVKTVLSGRYVVLMDETIDLNAASSPVLLTTLQGAVGYDNTTVGTKPITQTISLDRFIDCSKKNLQQLYQSTSNPSTVADLSSGAVYFIAKCRDADTLYNLINGYDCVIRVKYSDI